VLRVVVDPGVLVSALISDRGSPRELVRRWIDGELEFVVCPLLLDELRTVLLRRAFRKYVAADDAVAFVEFLRLTASMKRDPEAQPGLTPDPKDDYLVALARTTAADCVVSGDAHLTGLPDPAPPVLTPRELVLSLA
jgi:uncharacterized protein